MALHTLGQAAKLVGKSKPTLSRACKSGTLSFTKNEKNEYQIDTSELERVYGKLQPTSNDTGTMKQSETPNNDKVLQAEIEMLRERVNEKDNQIDDLKNDRDEWRQQAQKVTALIEDHSAKPKGLWARLTSK